MVHVTTASPSVDPNSRDARARRAVSVFRSLQPVLTGYAQAITGRKDVQVLMSSTSNGETDGRRIMMRPPIALGDALTHVPPVCNRRNPDKHQLCPACAQREEIMLPIFHEIAHIANDTFMKPSDEDIKNILADTVRASGTRFAESIKKKIEHTEFTSYIAIATAISEFLPIIVNVLEDARIDSAMFRARPGIKPMYWSMLNKIRDRGTEGQNPFTGAIEYEAWSEKPLNFQVMFGCWGIIAQYDMSGWFHPQVEEALLDDKLREILYSVRAARTARETYRTSFDVLERLRELGYCQLPEEPDVEEDEGEGDPEEGEGGEKSEENTPGDSGSAGDGDGEASGSSSGGSRPSSGSDSDPEDEDKQDDPKPEDAEEDVQPDDSDGDEDRSGERDDDSDPTGKPDGSPGGDDEADGDDSDGAPDDGPDEGGDDETDSSEDSPADEADEGPGEDAPELGGPDQVQVYVVKAGGHEEWSEKVEAKKQEDPDEVMADEDRLGSLSDDDKAVIIAIIQGLFFDRPSVNVTGVKEHHFDQRPTGRNKYSSAWARSRGDGLKIEIPQNILGRALLQMRLAFSENFRKKKNTNLKSGHVNGRVLGRRAPVEDERLFMKRSRPGRRKYHVVIGLDISGSTGYMDRIEQIKRAAFAQAELCHRLGIDFEMYAHTGSIADIQSYEDSGDYELALDIYFIKELNEPWNDKVQHRLRALNDSSANIDGHTLEYYRKRLDAKRYTDNIIVYYTDGSMPLENYEEELEILLREIRICKQKKYTLLFVGVANDEPKRKYGLDMVRLDSDADIVKVVEALGERLAG